MIRATFGGWGIGMAQMGFFDLSDRCASLDTRNDPAAELDAVVPWEDFRPAHEQVWRKPEAERKSRAGRKPMDAVVMFRALVLAALYNLSADQIEYQVRDRLSVMRFPGLGLDGRVPDAKTVWLYREALVQAGMVEALFRQFDGHLARQGYIARGGQVLDASIVPVPRNHNTRDQNKAIKNGEVPEERDGPGADLLEARKGYCVLQGQVAGFRSGVAVRRKGLHQLLHLGGVLAGDCGQGPILPKMFHPQREVRTGPVLHLWRPLRRMLGHEILNCRPGATERACDGAGGVWAGLVKE